MALMLKTAAALFLLRVVGLEAPTAGGLGARELKAAAVGLGAWELKAAALVGLMVAGLKAAALVGLMVAGLKAAALEVAAGPFPSRLSRCAALQRGLDSVCPVPEFALLKQLSLREHGRLMLNCVR